MPSVQARRTLVKSPPELWAELSDAEALARRLEQFGEIRITRLEPESTVAWQGERARGTVEIEPSGWGTRVTLTAEADEPASPAAVDDPTASGDGEDTGEPEPEPPTSPGGGEEGLSQPATAEPEELPQTTAALGQAFPLRVPGAAPGRTEPAHRPGLWSRLFRRQRQPASPVLDPSPALAAGPDAEPQAVLAPAPQPSDLPPAPEPSPEAEAAPPEPEAQKVSQPAPEAPAEPSERDTGAVPAEPETRPSPQPPSGKDPHACPGLAAEELDGVLAGVLDALGAAHHRPFSRA